MVLWFWNIFKRAELVIIDGINYRTHDYERNEIRAKFFPFQPCSPFQKPRTAGSLIPESFFWEWELVDINKIKYPSNTSNTRPTRISNLATPPPPPSYIVCRLCMEQDDSYAWNMTGRQLCVEQDDSYGWNMWEFVWQIFLLQYTNPHNIHAHQDQQIFSHNIQAYKEIPQRQKQRSMYMYMGKKESNLWKAHLLWKKVWERIISWNWISALGTKF